MTIVERLDPKMISRHKKRGASSAQVADCKGKHPVQALHTVRTLLFVEVHDHFCVCMRSEAMTFALEFAAQHFEVVNLAVVGNPNRAVLVRYRHMAVCGKIEDGKA